MPLSPRLLRPIASAGAPTPSGTPASLLLRFNGNFNDSSPNVLTATPNGDAATSSAQSKWGGGSLLLQDGYVTITQDPLLAMGTGDFTIECWAYLNSYTVGAFWDSTGVTGGTGERTYSFIWFLTADGVMRLFHAATELMASPAAAVPLGEWAHLACVRSNGVTKFFVNGLEVSSTTSAINDTVGGGSISAGTEGGSANGWQLDGYIDDFRVVKGLAVYSGPFDPPTAPLPAYANPVPVGRSASLLLHFDGNFADSSPSQHSTTPIDDASIDSSVKKFGDGAAQFDGSGDYMTVPSSAFNLPGDFTIEWFMRVGSSTLTEVGGNQLGLFGNGRRAGVAEGMTAYIQTVLGQVNLLQIDAHIGGSWQFPFLQATAPFVGLAWQHCAVVRAGNTYTLYIDGVAVDTATSSSAPQWPDTALGSIGSTAGDTGEFVSYGVPLHIDDFRVVKGLAVYTADFTPPTAPLSVVATPCPANASLVLNFDGNFDDESANALAVTANGDAAISASEKKFGGGAAYFDGSGDYLSLPASAALGFGTCDFTVECWIYPLSTAGNVVVVDTRPGDVGQPLVLGRSSSGALRWYDGATIYTAGSIPQDEWTHIAWSRAGGISRLFVNGEEVDSFADISDGESARGLTVGSNADPQYENFHGYIDGLRICKFAVYDGPFTPPTVPPAPAAIPAVAPSCGGGGCDPYGTYLYDGCGGGDGCDFGSYYADGACGQYFDPWYPGGCCV